MLLSAEGIFSLILNELELLNNHISRTLYEAIIKSLGKCSTVRELIKEIAT